MLLLYLVALAPFSEASPETFKPVPISEMAELTGPNQATFLSYPKYYKNAEGMLTEVNTTLVRSSSSDWDYEVTTGIWNLRVRLDGTFQASHEGDVFTYRFQNLGIGQGKAFHALELGTPNWSNAVVVGDTIRWIDVFPYVDVTVRYIHDILKVDVIVKKDLMGQIKNDMRAGKIGEENFLTARFDIPQVLITSQAKRGKEEIDLYTERLDLNEQGLRFEKEGKTIHSLRPVESFILDKEGQDIRLETPIRCAQAWFLNPSGSGHAEISANLDDLYNAPEGDVVIDPSTDFGVSKDAYIDSYAPSQNFGSASYLYVGSTPYDGRFLIAFSGVQSFLGVNPSLISADMIFQVATPPTSNIDVKAYKVTSGWDESTVTWNNHGSGYTSSYTGNLETIGTSASLVSIDVETPLLSHYQDYFSYDIDMIYYCGFHVKGENSPASQCAFYSSEYYDTSKRPKLEISYNCTATITPANGTSLLQYQRIKATCNSSPSGTNYSWSISGSYENSSTSGNSLYITILDNSLIGLSCTVTFPDSSTSTPSADYYVEPLRNVSKTFVNGFGIRDWPSGTVNSSKYGYPINSYPRNQVYFSLNYSLTNTTPIQIYGDGNSFDYGTQQLNLLSSGGYSTTLQANSVIGTALQSAFSHSVYWKFRVQNSYDTNWGSWRDVPIGSSSVTLYTSYSTPLVNTPYDFALTKANAYANGQSSISSIASAICSGIDGDFDYDPEEDPIAQNILTLYNENDRDSDGDPEAICYDNAKLLHYLCHSIGINGTYYEFWGGCTSSYACMYKIGNLLPTFQISASANDFAPANPHFFNHAIVYVNGIYYDPSYNIQYASTNSIDQSILQYAPASPCQDPGHVGQGVFQIGATTPESYHRCYNP